MGISSIDTPEIISFLSAAKCARVSYTTFDQDVDRKQAYEQHFLRAINMIKQGHMSPFEHQASTSYSMVQSRNFSGFLQFREYIEEERIGLIK